MAYLASMFFITHKKYFLGLGAAIVLASIIILVTLGLRIGIDFTGGTVIEIKTPQVPDLTVLRRDLNALDVGGISIQEFGAPDDLLIRIRMAFCSLN